MLVTAVVRRILLSVSNSTDEGVTARGVEFSYGGSIYVVNARKEVILSAGCVGLHIDINSDSQALLWPTASFYLQCPF